MGNDAPNQEVPHVQEEPSDDEKHPKQSNSNTEIDMEDSFTEWLKEKRQVDTERDKKRGIIKVNWDKLKHSKRAKVVIGGGTVLLVEYGVIVAVEFACRVKITLEKFFKYASKFARISTSGALTGTTMAAGAPLMQGIFEAIHCCIKWAMGKYSKNDQRNREIAKKELKRICVSMVGGSIVSAGAVVGVVAAVSGTCTLDIFCYFTQFCFFFFFKRDSVKLCKYIQYLINNRCNYGHVLAIDTDLFWVFYTRIVHKMVN